MLKLFLLDIKAHSRQRFFPQHINSSHCIYVEYTAVWGPSSSLAVIGKVGPVGTMRDVMGFYHCDFMSKFKIIKLFSNKIFFTILNKNCSYKHLLTKVLKIFNYFSRSEFGSLENISDPDSTDSSDPDTQQIFNRRLQYFWRKWCNIPEPLKKTSKNFVQKIITVLL